MIQPLLKTLNKLYSTIFIVLISSMLLFTSSCEEDKNPCYDVKCNPYQYCFEGTCISIKDDSLALGETRNPPIPNQLLLSNFVLSKLPFKNLIGNSWDPNNGAPDLFISVTQGTLILWETTTPIVDVSQVPYSVTLDSTVIVDNVSKPIAINIYDDDGTQFREYMGGLFIYPYIEANGYPDILASNPNGTLAGQFDVVYVFN